MKLDKQLHFLAGILLALYATVLGIISEISILIIALNAIVISAIAGVVKELIDRRQPSNHFDKKDLFCTLIGGIVVGVPLILIYIFKIMIS